MAVRILVYEKDSYFRKELTAQLATLEGYALLGSFSDTKELENQFRRFHPHVVLMDVELAVEQGKAVTIWLQQEFPQVDVLLTSEDLDERVLAGISAGASGYLLKKKPTERILRAIFEVYARIQ